jgi:hypothetical protein
VNLLKYLESFNPVNHVFHLNELIIAVSVIVGVEDGLWGRTFCTAYANKVGVSRGSECFGQICGRGLLEGKGHSLAC